MGFSNLDLGDVLKRKHNRSSIYYRRSNMSIIKKIIKFFKRKEKEIEIIKEEDEEMQQLINTNETLFRFVLDLATARTDDEIDDVIDRARDWTGLDGNESSYLH